MTTSRSVLLISLIALILAAFVPAVSALEDIYDEDLYEYIETSTSDVVLASDGMTWTRATASAGWSARVEHTSLVYDGKMWVIGGGNGGLKNDVWWSTDGITWNRATASAGWGPRWEHTSLVYDGKMWVMGGFGGGTTRYNDVWWSTDGITWFRATANAGWSPRSEHTSVVYDGKMWVIGGYGSDGLRKNDVWWSTDGIKWTKATDNAGWSPRERHTSVVYDGKMWVIGGYDGFRENDVWWSTDGITWNRATASAGWIPRDEHTSVVYDYKMWVMGGTDGGIYNDVWWSTDGITWNRATASAVWSERQSHTSLVYDGKMWVIGGRDTYRKNDVWWFEAPPQERTVTVTMTDIDGNKISGFEVRAVNAFTGESYTVSTGGDVAYITLPMDQKGTVPNPQTGEYEEAPFGRYYFYGYKPGYEMFPDYAIQVNVLPEKYMPYVFCDIIVAPVGSVPDDPNKSPVIVHVRNAQTGALLADATVIIKDTRTDPWTEVVNQTLPSGQGTFYLQNDFGDNPNQYFITALLPGYSDIYNGRYFRVTGLTYIFVEMEPIEGGPVDENNTILEFYVRDPDGNPVSDAMVSVADQSRWTNAQGWIRFEVPKNAAYSYTVRKFGYITIEGRVTVGDGPRHTVNVVLTPTQPPGPGEPTPGPTPTSGVPGDDGSEGFLSEAVRGIGKLFGVGFSTAKMLLGMLLALSIGFTTAKKLRGGAAEFGLGLLGGTMLGVLVGLLPVWTIVVLLLVVGMYIGYRYVGGGNNG